MNLVVSLLFLTVSWFSIVFSEELAKRKRVLSFGGNGMIGSAVLHRMIKSNQYNITLVSRGNWHYDSSVRIKPYVKALVCNRNRVPKCDNCSINALKHCPDVVEEIDSISGYDIVLDFSAYQPKWIHDAIDILKNKTIGIYVYISSDAVYEVSKPKSSDRLSIEEDAIRPEDLNVRKKLNQQDRYGDAKFGGEEVLQDQKSKENGFPWVAFRYADVIGPRDNTRRFAFYHTWLKFFDDIKVPFYMPQKLEKVSESITYVEDAADNIIHTIDKGADCWNQAYNIATLEVLSLKEIIQKMAKTMNVTVEEFDTNDHNLHMYPTVYSGGMSMEKAMKMLDFVPTDFDMALKSSIEWYDNEFLYNYVYREEMISDLMARIVPRDRRNKFYLAVDRELSKFGNHEAIKSYKAKRKGDIENLEKFERPSSGAIFEGKTSELLFKAEL